MIKVYISPNYTGQEGDKPDGGIRRVIEAMQKYLPEFGIEVVNNPDEADIINAHGAMPISKFDKPIVSSCHGLYWAGYDWGAWAHRANQLVIESMKRASAVTAPSYWVKNAITRGMLVDPTVIYHGVEIDDFTPDENPADWVLWNKARVDPISDPSPVNELARLMPDVRFVTTFGDETKNVKVLDAMPYERMKKVVAKAGVYLATTRETFGIGTLEAMACGVPVVGWAFGGQVEIIKQGITGYLVPEGNYEQLQKAIRLALKNRAELGKNARQDVIERWQWKDKIEQYANLFYSVYNDLDLDNGFEGFVPKISVIVTNYNLEKYLPNAIHSVLEQKYNDYELIVVDDKSDTDDSWHIVQGIKNENPDIPIYHMRPKSNLGLSGARNHGFKKARGKYIIYLDADDMLAPNALEILSTALDNDPAIHVAYGHLDLINDDGTGQRRNASKSGDHFPPAEYNWRGQLAHLNQLPYAAMMRRQVLENSGGYRVRDSRNEDASFWARVTSYGFVAKKVTQVSTLIYRLRGDSKSANEMRKFGKEPNWLAWLPFRFADKAKDGEKLDRRNNGEIPNAEIVPFGAQGLPPRSWSRTGRYWNVRHHQNPVLSVVIPVGPGHKDYVIDALDSLVAQDFQEWEAIVVNDTGESWHTIPGAPYARIVVPKNKHPDARGAGEARNAGVAAAKSGLILFLDADDYLLPGALSTLYEVWQSTDGNCVVYGDWIVPRGDELPDYYKSYDFTCDINNDNVILRRIIHPVTALYPKWAHDKIGGFNITMPAWEDWDYQIKMYAHLGLCGVRIEQALLAYRPNTGLRRKAASYVEADPENYETVKATNDRMKKFLYNEHIDYYRRKKHMACRGGCPDGKPYNKSLAELSQGDFQAMVARNGDGMILQFLGPVSGKFTVKMDNKQYRTMITPDGMLIFDVHPKHAEILMMKTRKGNPLWREFQPPQPVVKAEPVKASAPKLPENNVVMDDIWADVPTEEVEPVALGQVRSLDSYEFDTVADFRDWMDSEGKPDEETLSAMLIAEQNGKGRKTIISEINKLLNG